MRPRRGRANGYMAGVFFAILTGPPLTAVWLKYRNEALLNGWEALAIVGYVLLCVGVGVWLGPKIWKER